MVMYYGSFLQKNWELKQQELGRGSTVNINLWTTVNVNGVSTVIVWVVAIQ